MLSVLMGVYASLSLMSYQTTETNFTQTIAWDQAKQTGVCSVFDTCKGKAYVQWQWNKPEA